MILLLNYLRYVLFNDGALSSAALGFQFIFYKNPGKFIIVKIRYL